MYSNMDDYHDDVDDDDYNDDDNDDDGNADYNLFRFFGARSISQTFKA